MSTRLKTRDKDLWDIFHICAQIMIALIALLFTILFSQKRERNAEATLQLAASNYEVAKSQAKVSEERMKATKAQVKNALLPSLTSADPKQRDLGMYLAKTLDESFATDVASVLALHDPDLRIRKNARSTLGSLSLSQQEGVKEKAEKGLNRYEIMNELSAKGLLKKLDDAQNYLYAGNISGRETALRIYVDVVNQLSPNARDKLDQKLLSDAEKAYKEGHFEDAVRNFSRLFTDYRQSG